MSEDERNRWYMELERPVPHQKTFSLFENQNEIEQMKYL